MIRDIIKVAGADPETLQSVLKGVKQPFAVGDRIGIKVHWGERGNHGFLHPRYARELVRHLKDKGQNPFVFDTTVLYSGGRHTGPESLKTAADHGFTEDYLGCPVLIGDGIDGRDVIELPCLYKHFSSVQAGGIMNKAQGYVILSHFKGHMGSGFGGAIKNISMGFASRAQKQRMHADAYPALIAQRCNRCGLCAEVCPAGAAVLPPDSGPVYDLEKCIGCSQCIALCPQSALKIFWSASMAVFQERLVETAAALWNRIGHRSVIINALLKITAECDCMPGRNQMIADDYGFIAGTHPVAVDEASVRQVGAETLERAHRGLGWQRQFAYAREIGFTP
jgi:uncharacterized protein